jgi:acyl dehydratase
MLVGLLVVAAVVGVIETTVTDDVAPEVVEVQPVVMQANTKINRPRFTQPIYCGLNTAA